MIFLASDNIFEWVGMIDSITGEYVNSATVTGSLKDLDGVELVPFTLEYVSGSDGDYLGTITAVNTTNLIDCESYIVDVTATFNGASALRRETHTAIYQGYK